MLDYYTARQFRVARLHFAKLKTNRNAATLLRAALNAVGADVIDEEEMEGIVFDIIDYLEVES